MIFVQLYRHSMPSQTIVIHLHTNAYDEAVTTPTPESVRRAIAIQLVINKELGLTKNENPLQGSYFFTNLTDMVEEAILSEFDRNLRTRGSPRGYGKHVSTQ